MSEAYKFEVIDLKSHADICAHFRRISYQISFGTDTGLDAEMGPQNARYFTLLSKNIADFPEGNSHLWHHGRIIGQTEMKMTEDSQLGYVNFFFIVPELRGKGLGNLLHQRACDVFAAHGKSRIQLSVSPSNQQALSFYRKNGWQCLGPRPGKEHMWLMEYALTHNIPHNQDGFATCRHKR